MKWPFLFSCGNCRGGMKIQLEYTESLLTVRMVKTVSSYLKMLLNSFIKCLTAVQTCQRYSRYDA